VRRADLGARRLGAGADPEPDAALQAELRLTYLFISHNMAVVRHMSDEIAVMYLGRIVEQAPAEQLFAAARHPYTRLLLETIPTWKRRTATAYRWRAKCRTRSSRRGLARSIRAACGRATLPGRGAVVRDIAGGRVACHFAA
jgi:peptide/nickel transport system ATP-binding protein